MIHSLHKNILFLRISLWGLLLSVILACQAGQLQAQNAIGGSVADPSAILNLQSNDKGVLIPRMTTAQRTAIANPAVGLMIYNTSLGCVEVNAGTPGNPDWNCLFALAGEVATINCGAATGIISLIKNNPVSDVSLSIPYTGASGGFYSSQTVASTGVTGLTATISAGRFSYDTGNISCSITGTPTEEGVATFALSIGGQDCSLSLPVIAGCGAYVASGVWKEFMCHNLGANTQANPFIPSWELNGNYYQWGRNPTCFGRDGIDAPNPCSSPVYGAAGPWGSTTANDNAGAITGWSTTSAENGAWLDDSKTVNDPCPTGWRVPTAAQLTGLANSTLNPRTSVGTWTGSTTNYSVGYRFGQSLFLPAAGGRSPSGGASLFSRGSEGYYRSSTESSSSGARYLFFSSSGAVLNTSFRADGFSLRCVVEPPPATLTGLDCTGSSNIGRPVVNVATSGVSIIIPYSGSNGGIYSSQSVSSTGVTGLTAVLDAGTLAIGSGTIRYIITGIPAAIGTASFELSIGGQSCTVNLPVLAAATISSLNCGGASNIGTLTAGIANSASSSLPYTGGNGGTYSGQVISSSGVTGLTATLSPGAFAIGSGSLLFVITGIPSGPGTASFAVNIGGQSCTFSLAVATLTVGNCGAFVAAGVWKQFMCHNLGANTSADPFTPSWELNGNYYQWGRNPTCFGRDGIDAPNPCSSPVYGAAAPWGNTTANDNSGEITGWSGTAAANGAWVDGSKTVSDPCPAGWRVPTAAQLGTSGLLNTTLNPRTSVGTWTGSTTNYSVGYRFGESLFLPAAGYLSIINGRLFNQGIQGNYWSSTGSGSTTATCLYFFGGVASMSTSDRTYGFSLRCVAE